MLIKTSPDNMNQMEIKNMVTHQIILKKNLSPVKYSGLYLTLSKLKNQNKLQKDVINSMKNSMSRKKGSLEKTWTLEKMLCY